MAHWSGIGIPKTNAIALEVSYTHETKVSDNDFVFPPEEELVGPEYDARFDDPAFLQSQTDHDYPRDADTDAILRDLHSMPSYSSRHATRSSRSISTTK